MTYADGSKSAISAATPIVDGCEECVDAVNESCKQLGGDLVATIAVGLQARGRAPEVFGLQTYVRREADQLAEVISTHSGTHRSQGVVEPTQLVRMRRQTQAIVVLLAVAVIMFHWLH